MVLMVISNSYISIKSLVIPSKVTKDSIFYVIDSMQKDAAEKINLGIFDRVIPEKSSPNNSPG